MCSTKIKTVEEFLSRLGKVIVAFSGGTDSTLLLALALRVMGPQRVLAVTADSPSLARADLQEARDLARGLGAGHVILRTEELKDDRYAANPPDRCFFCKQELFRRLEELRIERGFDHLLYGAIADDLDDLRPGMRAAEQAGAVAPLLKAGFGKKDVRETAQALGLPNWDKPAAPCLASRIPYHILIDEHKLGQIEQAEALLHDILGCREVRVRHHGVIARIEVAPEHFDRLLQAPVRELIVKQFGAMGFSFTALDLEGFRSGRMNEGL